MPQTHPYLSLRIPPNSPFELKPSSGKGWGAFSTAKIPRGTLILEEQPLFITKLDPPEFHEADARMAYQNMSPEAKRQFSSLRNNGGERFSNMADVWAENSFSMYNKSQSSGHALFVLMSRFNHSCVPNARIPVRHNEAAAIFAVRDIELEEEITFCYTSDLSVRVSSQRRRVLGFPCQCQACQISTPFHELSEARRTLLRGLDFLTGGKEVVNEGQDLEKPIIFDPKLRKQVQDFDISLSSRFIYDILIVYLLEEEGLLDEFLLKELVPAVTTTKDLFRNRDNIKMASLALAQPTWFGRVCVAFSMYGREDPADRKTAAMFRAMDELPVNKP
ncbi:SET domain protein [Rutstroemia sp. NJR-2017a WRK4]|nr:SET domain protein [Rutstroemia sp. NJR-2017a WRK4]